MNKIEIKKKIVTILKKIAKTLKLSKEPFLIEPKTHADFSTNFAIINKSETKPSMELAKEIVELLLKEKDKLFIENIEIAQPGFINIFLNKKYFVDAVNYILKQKDNYGKGNKGGELNVEWVSANPTGYLHVGHARNAAIGSVVSNICEFAGVHVTREYYINDAGNQINMLAESIFARYQQIFDKKYPMPEEAYKGSDISWAAEEFNKRYGDKYKGVKLEGEVLDFFKVEGTNLFLGEIKKDLEKFGMKFDIWFSEKSLYANNREAINKTIAKLKNTYEKDGATWLKTTIHGDDKDRVLIKSDGDLTYFTPDITYHNIKFSRTKETPVVINVWGADHSGYIKRMKCAMEDLGWDPNRLIVLCMQLVRLVKNGEEYKMSKRKGTSFYLREFVDLVGVDNARFILLDRTYNSRLDFDIDIATKKTNDNPVVLIQYANARAHALLNKVQLKKNSSFKALKFENENDYKLISVLMEFPEIIERSADLYLTNLLTQYMIKLAKEFNSWYSNTPKTIGSENETSLLALVKATTITLEIGMKLLGISIAEKM